MTLELHFYNPFWRLNPRKELLVEFIPVFLEMDLLFLEMASQ
jgi:hypothetical protein